MNILKSDNVDDMFYNYTVFCKDCSGLHEVNGHDHDNKEKKILKKRLKQFYN